MTFPDAPLLRAAWRSWAAGNLQRVGPRWLHWAFTLMFCAIVAVGFTVLGFFAFARESHGAWRNAAGWLYWYGRNLIVSTTIGVLIHLGYDMLGAALGGPAAVKRWQPWQRTVFFSSVPLVCVAVGWPLGVWLAGGSVMAWMSGPEGSNVVVGTVLLSLLLTFIVHHFFAARARQIQAEQRATEAQLRLLQGQIEPHFLFNTLANVISLIDHDPARARQMLEAFTDYLRGSLTGLRHGEATLGSELDLVSTYLGLLQTRMEDRLRFSITADPRLRSARLPPLLLQPLVENAIHHGLEPKLAGGHVRVSACAQGATLVIEVADDGLGLAAPPRRRNGSGVALANVRERLLTQYGTEASLTLADACPGTVATLRLPHLTAPAP